jgi:Fe-S oxidoreductase
MKMRDDDELKEALYCIRCSACMNVCANFQTVGGHAFGGEYYTGGIGASWTVGTSGDIKKGRFAELCSGCTRCIPNCPVRINIPRLNTVIKNRLLKQKAFIPLQKKFFGHYAITGKITSLMPGMANKMTNIKPVKHLLESMIGFDSRRQIPRVPGKTLQCLYKEYRAEAGEISGSKNNLVLFSDIYTNYNNPEVGIGVIKLFEKLNLPVSLSKTISEGRAAQSQGLIELAGKEAEKTARYLAEIIDKGNDIIVTEPSVLSMFRFDYKELLKDNFTYSKIAQHVFDPVEYILNLNQKKALSINEISKRIISRDKLFYHEHCQAKLINSKSYVKELFGSFGYKKQFYDLSKSIGRELTKQIKPGHTILAIGTSCREQISSELHKKVYHPVEYLEMMLK